MEMPVLFLTDTPCVQYCNVILYSPNSFGLQSFLSKYFPSILISI